MDWVALMPLESIDRFEISNNIAINVYEPSDDKRVVPLRVSVIANARATVDLLLIEQGERRHYCLITNLEKLLQHVTNAESSFVQLPKNIAAKRACVNVQCDDGKSFKWSMLAAKYGGSNLEHRHRVDNYYDYAAEFDDYRYPMETQDILKFEKNERIAVNVYTITGVGAIEPVRVSEFLPNDPSVSMHVDLLLIKKHYMWIRSLSRLVRSQVTSHRKTHFICRRCLHFCQTEEVLAKHTKR